MGTVFKYNETEFNSIISKCGTAIEKGNDILNKFSSLSDMKINLSDTRVKKNSIDDEGNEIVDYDYTSNAQAYNDLLDKLANKSSGTTSDYIKKFVDGMTNYKNALLQIQKAIDEFDGNIPSLKSALSSIEGFDCSNWKFETNDQGVEIVSYSFADSDGNKYYVPVAEMVNCAYTATNMMMNQAVLAGLNGEIPDMSSISNSVNSFVSAGVSSNAFGVTSSENINNVVKNNGYSMSDYDSKLKELYNTNNGLESQTAGVIASGFSAAGIALAAFSKSNLSDVGTDNVKQPIKQILDTSSSRSLENDFSESDNGPITNDELVEEVTSVLDPVSDFEHLDDIKIVEINDEKIPDLEEIKPINVEKDYDKLARLEYEKITVEELDEYRAEIINDINEKYDIGDFESIKEKLKEYGYSESDIENVIKDRQATITALLVSDEKQQLSKIANDLASKDDVTDFKSSYDVVSTYIETVDGTSSTLLANISNDENVMSARKIVNENFEAYNNKVNETTNLINYANDSKAKMESLKNDFTNKFKSDDPSRWDSDAISQYNDSINKYNDAVSKSNEAVKYLTSIKFQYDDSVNQLNKVESNLLDNIKKENRRIDLIGEENINTETNEVLDVIENDRLFDKVNDNSSEEIIFDEANDSINNNLFENKDVINEKNEDSIDVDNSYNVSDSELLDLLDNKLNVNSSTLNESEILDLSENEILNMNQENVLNNDSSNSVNEILF